MFVHHIAPFISLIHFVSAADTTAKLLYEQLMCGLVELVASNAIVKFYFSVVFQWLSYRRHYLSSCRLHIYCMDGEKM